MKPARLSLLRCCLCEGDLAFLPSDDAGREGILRCPGQHVFPVLHGVPRMLPEGLAAFPRFTARHQGFLREAGVSHEVLAQASPVHRAAPSMERVRRQFERQWAWWGEEERLYGRTLEEMEAMLRDGYVGGGWDAESFRGRRVLDAGCGHGSFVRGFARLGAHAVGLEYGSGVDLAAGICRDTGDAFLVQGSITDLPFANESFDLVFCHGVLPFLPDAREGFLRLAEKVKPGGSLRIWVYPKGGAAWETTQRLVRAVTTRLPPRLLYALCYLPVPLLSLVTTYSNTHLGNSTWKQCAQVVWDYYSPPVQWHNTVEEIREWYQAAGFEEPAFLEIPHSAVGRKPGNAAP